MALLQSVRAVCDFVPRDVVSVRHVMTVTYLVHLFTLVHPVNPCIPCILKYTCIPLYILVHPVYFCTPRIPFLVRPVYSCIPCIQGIHCILYCTPCIPLKYTLHTLVHSLYSCAPCKPFYTLYVTQEIWSLSAHIALYQWSLPTHKSKSCVISAVWPLLLHSERTEGKWMLAFVRTAVRC